MDKYSRNIVLITLIIISFANIGFGTSDDIEYISIDANYHHLGDADNALLFPEMPNYEGIWYVQHFNVYNKKEKMYLLMQTRDIDPSIEGGPSRVFLNGKFCTYLNQYVEEERLADEETGEFIDNFASLQIEVDPELFNIGDNSIIIIVGADEDDGEISFLDEENLDELDFIKKDDIEFWDLGIRLEGNII